MFDEQASCSQFDSGGRNLSKSWVGLSSGQFCSDAHLFVVVPTYNERRNVPELVTRIQDALLSVPFELLIVDDDSPDGTSAVAEEPKNIFGNLHVLKRNGKFGLSSAVVEGFRKV